jgi:hypothetical protein
MIAGMTPRRTSENANVASVVHTARSAAAIRPSPPARAGPPTHATTGLGNSQIAASTSPSSSAGMRPSARASAVSFRSTPEQNTGPVCDNTTARTAVSVSAALRPSSSSRISGVERALRFAGLSRVSLVTPATVAVRTSSMPGTLTAGVHT